MTTLVVGPFPPPVHGQSLATAGLVGALRKRGIEIETLDTSEGTNAGAIAKIARKLGTTSAALRRTHSTRGAVYLSANSGVGMWLTTALAAAAASRGRPLLLHHHSYDHVRNRRLRMVALTRMAGPSAVHIVLGGAMDSELRTSTPEVRETFVLNNAGLIDQSLLELPLRVGNDLVLGHLSNLTADKGVNEVVALAIAARRAGMPVRLTIAGPTGDRSSAEALALAGQALGQDFKYRGSVTGIEKKRFYGEISHFVFPTRYRNEASPLVLMEAMAAGATCIATARGCIADDLGEDGGITVGEDEDFAARALAHLRTSDVMAASAAARRRYRQLLGEHEDQLDALAAMLV